MKIHLVSPVHFEKWDWRNGETGIGGSETCHIELSWRLARRGYEVHAYSPLPEDSLRQWRGTTWHDLEEADYEQDGLWIFFRNPEAIENITVTKNRRVWLNLQDENVCGSLGEDRAAKIDRVMCISHSQSRRIIAGWPILKDKIFIATDGIKVDTIRKVEAEGIERIPTKLVYASSPDRGLLQLIKVFAKAREQVPELELHCFYGCDNIEKLIDFNPKFGHYVGFVEKLKAALETPGVVWRGRIGQTDLYREWFSAGIWCYPTHFIESACIVCMEAQAMGAIPIVNPIGSLEENVRDGVWIQGDNQIDRLTQCRFADAIVQIAQATEAQDEFRGPMMTDARIRFNWERTVDIVESFLLGDAQLAVQWLFQRKHASGRVLQLGCDVDSAGFKSLRQDNVNLDVMRKHPTLGYDIDADVYADARFLPDELFGQFDSVICGEMLEHMTPDDGVKVLTNAKRALRNGGTVVITCPNDDRGLTEDIYGAETLQEYTEGVSGLHRAMTLDELKTTIKRSGLTLQLVESIDYTHFEGWGIVAR